MPPKGTKVIAQNRKARHDYTVLEVFECGIALKGSEVKSLRAGQIQLRDSYARVEKDEVWLHGVHVMPYANASGAFGLVDPDRPRKLLLHRREIKQLAERTQQDSLTLVPLAVYFNEDGRAKLELALAKGRHTYDKRRAIAERDVARDTDRAIRGRERGDR
jgi:SsrA-binding protein